MFITGIMEDYVEVVLPQRDYFFIRGWAWEGWLVGGAGGFGGNSVWGMGGGTIGLGYVFISGAFS